MTTSDRLTEMENILSNFRIEVHSQPNLPSDNCGIRGSIKTGYAIHIPATPIVPSVGFPGALPPPVIILTGACCDDFSNCSITTEADCTGTYAGDGTVCDPNPCETGACCEFNGTCQDVSSPFLCGDCSIGNSCWLGFGTSCDTARCEGACCCFDPATGCQGTNVTYDECQAICPLGNGWLLNGTCGALGC